jgi:hypothetical protein
MKKLILKRVGRLTAEESGLGCMEGVGWEDSRTRVMEAKAQLASQGSVNVG